MNIIKQATYGINDYKIHQREYLYRGFIQVEKVSLTHQLFNKTSYTPNIQRELIHRPEAAGVLLYDDEHHAVAAVHAGWRGTLNRIAHRAIVEMCNVYKSNPSRIKAVIGPGISMENFEVGDEVYQQFETVGFNMSLISKKYEKWHINLPECNHIQLREAGLKDENILMSGICTFSRSEDYFSARKLGQHSGRIFSGIMISE